ncbi:MAG: hypothetical protein II453_00210 [Alphaproteobacteria bacterium]|nr:hypothetical protein [Alphaproteobacteria bacterium]
MTDSIGVGHKIDSPDFASIVLVLKHNTLVAYQELLKFKKTISSNLLEIYPEYLQQRTDELYQLIYMQLQGTLFRNIKSLIQKHPELFSFTCRDVCRQTTSFIESNGSVKHIDIGPMVICELYVLNNRLFNLLKSCLREMTHRTEDDILRIFNQRWEEYKKQNGADQINHLRRSYKRLNENEKLTKKQYQQLYDSIFNEIKEQDLRFIAEVYIENPAGLINALRTKGYPESVLEQVFCAYTKLEELDRLYEQRKAPDQLNYNQKLTAFLTACVQDIQATNYSKDGETLIRGYNEWFYVFRIFEEKEVKGLNNCRIFVEELYKLNIKVIKMPPSAENLYKTKQEFKERLFPNWVPPESISKKFPRIIELGATALQAYEKHRNILV